jgi:NAD(P)-dependent dehydrogenase (short-subunit alcohol dehydrogenase family)
MAAGMDDKMVLITGATGGIGQAAALALANLGARVVIVGRDPHRTAAAAADIQQESANPGVEALIGDLSLRADVQKVAREYRQRYDRLDVLINNAGAMFMRRQLSADGIEMTLALNHLAYFSLTYQLLDLLKASAPARIVNVGSSSHRIARLDFDELIPEKGYHGLLAYARTKLMNVVFTYELARRLESSGVTANCLHPGLVGTRLGQNNNGLYRPAFALYQRVALSPTKGAETLVYLASSPEVEGVSGRYFVRKSAARSSPDSYDPQAGRRLWDLSLKLSGLDGRS